VCAPAKNCLSKEKLESGKIGKLLQTNRSKFLAFLVKRLGSATDAEDILQDFYVRVLVHLDQLRDFDRLEAWLYAVLRSTLNEHFRRSGRSTRLKSAVSAEMKSAETIQMPQDETPHFCECTKGLVPELSTVDAQIIRRIDVNEEDRATVAEELGLKPGTLNVRLHRARGALGKILIAHCGQCCREGYDDCYCPPAGCEHSQADTHC